METLSQRSEQAGRLGGAFFFKRGHRTRSNANVLFVTIPLQLAVHIPQLKLRISHIVEQNPTLVGRSIGVQLRELILRPCIGWDSPPWTIIIDGLDECRGHGVQQDILRLIRDSTQQPTPLRFIIASRPEAHIHETLEELSFRGLYRAFNVESSFNDVRIYLVREFARIHREHSTMRAIPTPWPSEEMIEHLVKKSSGFFIYASTIIKFVDDKHFRPTLRLSGIENLPGTGFQSPFGAIDQLYTQILSAIPERRHLVTSILRVIDIVQVVSLSNIDRLLGLEPGDTALALRGLHSVLHLEDWEGTILPHFIHASFSDFLRDPSRAGDFYIRASAGLAELARTILKELNYMYEDPVKNRNHPLAWCAQLFFRDDG
jgi:hypothetical protein